MMRRSGMLVAAVAIAGSLTLAGAGPALASTTAPNVDRNHTTAAKTTCVQRAVNVRGAGLVVDGIWGDRTQAAVKSYQSSLGLVVDGIVGPRTGSQMLTDLKRVSTTLYTSCYPLLPSTF